MNNVRFYLSVFLRRLPLFLPIAVAISAIAVIVAFTLPPAYVSTTQLVVESPQIPSDLAPSTVQVPPLEQLQIIRQRLLTRANMLEIARKLEVFPDLARMNPDEIVDAMRAHTDITTTSRRGEATFMSLSFEAPKARTAAAVLGEYLTLIQKEDARFRQSRAGETLQFFQQQVDKLAQDLETASQNIIDFKNANSGALPETLQFRVNQQAELQKTIDEIDRDTTALQDQRKRLIAIYEATGQFASANAGPQTADEKKLAQLRDQLDGALAVFSAEAPKVKLLRAQIAQLEAKVAAAQAAGGGSSSFPTADSGRPLALEVQLNDIDSKVASLAQQRTVAAQRLADVVDSIEKTSTVSIKLEELQRKYDSIQAQYNQTQDRLSTARTGELIETRSRGQEIAVIDPPAVPSEPTKPNRVLIGIGGSVFGIFAGLGIVLLMEVLNRSARRPEDLVKRFDIMPLATIPFSQTPAEAIRHRAFRLATILIILLGIPAAIYAVHTYYLPLDVLADRVMNKLGVRL